MKKTVSINLNGLIFNIDEDAFQLLSVYIDELKAYFSKQEAGNEIISDIESRIAEIFSGKINPSKQVLNIADVEEVISTLGRVEEIIGDDSEEKSESHRSENKKRKKLFRDPEARILGGVCAGLAEFSGINILAVRIIFAIFFLFSAGFMTLVYLILWLIVPKATTVADRLEMKGKDINISNIENTIKEEYRDMKEHFKKMKNSKGVGESVERAGKTFAGAINVFFGIFGKLIAALFIAAGVFLIFILAFGLFASSSDFFSREIAGFDMVPLPYMLQMFTSPTISWMFIASLAVVCFIPLISLVYAGITMMMKIKTSRFLNLSLLILWISGLAMMIALSVSLSTHFIGSGESVNKISLDSDTSKRIYIHTIKTIPEGVSTFSYDVNNMKMYRVNNNLIPAGEIEIHLNYTTDSLPYAEIVKTSRGATRTDANQYAGNISFGYSVNDSVFNINDYYYLPENAKLRGQEVEILFYLPDGYSIVLDECALDRLDDSNLPEFDEFPAMKQAVIMMHREGPELISR